MMKITYDNVRTRNNMNYDTQDERRDDMKPEDFLNELYELQNNQQMDNEQREYINHIIEEIWV